jgi:hypothetical protein
MGYWEEQQRILNEREYGKRGTQTFTHPENAREYRLWKANQQADGGLSFPLSSSSHSGGQGLGILALALGALLFWAAAAKTAEPYVGKDYAIWGGLGLLVIGWFAIKGIWWLVQVISILIGLSIYRVLSSLATVFEAIWDAPSGKAIILPATTGTILYGAYWLDGSRGIKIIIGLTLLGFCGWCIYRVAKWFLSRLVGQLLYLTVVLSGLVWLVWSLYQYMK